MSIFCARVMRGMNSMPIAVTLASRNAFIAGSCTPGVKVQISREPAFWARACSGVGVWTPSTRSADAGRRVDERCARRLVVRIGKAGSDAGTTLDLNLHAELLHAFDGLGHRGDTCLAGGRFLGHEDDNHGVCLRRGREENQTRASRATRNRS
jgi:hypothetical protein